MASTLTPPADASAQCETFDCRVRLPGWKLHLAHLRLWEGRDLGNVMDVAVEGALSHVRRVHPSGSLDESQTIRAIREEMKNLGIDPQATPPASELLIAEFLETGTIERGSLVWEFLALLTAKSESPWSVVDREALSPPLEFRLGEEGEGVVTPAGSHDCAGVPVLADQEGVKASPWVRPRPTDLEGCREPVFVCCLPKPLFRRLEPKSHMGRAVWLTWAYRFVFERTCSYREPTG